MHTPYTGSSEAQRSRKAAIGRLTRPPTVMYSMGFPSSLGFGPLPLLSHCIYLSIQHPSPGTGECMRRSSAATHEQRFAIHLLVEDPCVRISAGVRTSLDCSLEHPLHEWHDVLYSGDGAWERASSLQHISARRVGDITCICSCSAPACSSLREFAFCSGWMRAWYRISSATQFPTPAEKDCTNSSPVVTWRLLQLLNTQLTGLP